MKLFGEGKSRIANIILFIISIVLGFYFLFMTDRYTSVIVCFIIAVSCIVRPMIERRLK